MKRVVGGVLVFLGLSLYLLGQGVSYTGTLIEGLGNHIGDPLL